MEPTRNRLGRGGGAAARRLSCLLLALATVAPSMPALAEETAGLEPGEAQATSVRRVSATRDTTLGDASGPWDTTLRDTTLRERVGPVRLERFRAVSVLELRPDVVQGDDAGPRAAAFESRPAMLAAPASTLPTREASRSTWAIAGAAMAGSALGWAVGATAGLLATHDRFAQDDLSPLLYAVIGGVAVSVPAGAVSAHWASGGRGNILTSTLLGYAVAGATMLVWPDGGWALGPALAIPIAVGVEAP